MLRKYQPQELLEERQTPKPVGILDRKKRVLPAGHIWCPLEHPGFAWRAWHLLTLHSHITHWNIIKHLWVLSSSRPLEAIKRCIWHGPKLNSGNAYSDQRGMWWEGNYFNPFSFLSATILSLDRLQIRLPRARFALWHTCKPSHGFAE